MSLEKFKSHVSESVNQRIGQIQNVLQIFDPTEEDLLFEVAKSNFEEDRKRRALSQSRRSMRVVRIPSANGIFTTVESN